MTHPENEYGDFEGDFGDAKKAEQGQSVGCVPEGTYKVACARVDASGNGSMADAGGPCPDSSPDRSLRAAQ